jgi:hypothetical protein
LGGKLVILIGKIVGNEETGLLLLLSISAQAEQQQHP